MSLNLIACGFWLLIAAAIFITGLATGKWYLNVHLGDFPPFSSGWLALLLALYNLARWWSIRSYRRQRLAEQDALAKRFHRHRDERREPEQPPDPNFNFTEPPADPKEGQPPG
jgi:hypothetical protein